MSRQVGDAPCGKCGLHIYEIELELDKREPDGKGGYWWPVIGPDRCPECGEELRWYHKPGPIVFGIVVEFVKESIER